MKMATYSYLGKGKIYLKSTSGGGAMPIGNCSALEMGVETNSITQPDYTSAGGGNANEIARVASVSLNMTMLDFRPENLVIALRGTTAEIASVSVTDERHTAYAGGLVSLDAQPDADQPVTVTIDPAGANIAAVEGDDFALTNAGIVILETGGISDGDTVGVDYTKDDADVVQALTNSGDEYELIFDGLNEAETGKSVTVKVYRVKFSPAAALGFIGEDFGELSLEGSVLNDASKIGAGVSAYFQVALAK
jgi:hypothetical protein